jgi:hypothetical protein
MEVVETTVKVNGPVRVTRVQSGSDPKVVHRVMMNCSCKGFTYAGHCRHLELAAANLRHTARLTRSIVG